jgi:hypothetical protein
MCQPLQAHLSPSPSSVCLPASSPDVQDHPPQHYSRHPVRPLPSHRSAYAPSAWTWLAPLPRYRLYCPEHALHYSSLVPLLRYCVNLLPLDHSRFGLSSARLSPHAPFPLPLCCDPAATCCHSTTAWKPCQPPAASCGCPPDRCDEAIHPPAAHRWYHYRYRSRCPALPCRPTAAAWTEL